MSSQAQIAANRANAAHSVGPVSDEGKAIASRNAITHGVWVSHLLPGESESEFRELLDELRSDWQPAGLHQEVLIERAAVALWRLRRVQRARDAAVWLAEHPQKRGAAPLLKLIAESDPNGQVLPDEPAIAQERSRCQTLIAVAAGNEQLDALEARFEAAFDRAIAKLREQAEPAGGSGEWVVRKFVLAKEQAAIVDGVIAEIGEHIGGKNRPGRSLEFLAADFQSGPGLGE